MVTRRDFLEKSFLLGGGLLFSPYISLASERKLYLTSAIRHLNGSYGLVIFDMAQRESHILPVSHRCHSMAFSIKNNHMVFFDRRPGDFIYIVNPKTSVDQFTQVIEPPKNRKFYGHGCYSLDEKTMVVTANDLETLEGRLLIYDVPSNYTLVDDISSGGIGPHEIVRRPGKDTFYICNGGLKTHPDSGREILNLDSMDSNLSIMKGLGGSIKKYKVSDSMLSLRHIDVNVEGDAIVGLQDKDFFIDEDKSLVAFYNFEKDQFIEDTESQGLFTKAKGYVASVSIDKQSKRAVATCPKGNFLTLWDYQNKKLLDKIDLREASGTTYSSSDEEFIVTSGRGDIGKLKNDHFEKWHKVEFQWDNHAELF